MPEEVPPEAEVLTEVDGQVAIVTLNRPARLNAITSRSVTELIDVLESLSADPDVRALVLTGAGRAFCAGGDLRVMAGASSMDGRAPAAAPRAERASAEHGIEERDIEESTARIVGLVRVSSLLHAMPKVTIAAVNGPCAGAGMGIACAADLRIAGTSGMFTTGFAAVGQPGDYGLTWTLPRLVGSSRARDLLFLPERIDAVEALRLGIVSRVTADDDLLPTARAMAAGIAGRAPRAMAAMKANLNDAERVSFEELLALEAHRLATNQRTDDAREGARAFAEGRVARFTGR